MNTKTGNKSLLYRIAAIFMIVMMLLAAMPVTSAYAAGCNSTGSGNWNAAATWSCGHVPIPTTDTASILAGHTVTVTAAATTNQVTINSGGTVTIAAGVTLTISNGAGTDLTLNGTLVNNGTITQTGSTMIVGATGVYNHAVNNVALPIATWSTGSLLLVTGVTNNALVGLYQAFSDITWNSVNQTINDLRFNEMTAPIRNLTISSTGTGSIRLTSTTSGALTLPISGNYTQTGGKFNLSMGVNIGTLTVAGNFSHTGGTITEESTVSGAIVFNGAGTQTYTSGGTVLNTINYTVNNGATLLTGTSLVGDGSNGAFTLSAGGTLGIGSPAGITTTGATGNIRVTGTRAYNVGANYTYNGSVAQVTGNGLPATVNNLTINNAAGVTMTNAATTVNGALGLTNGILTTGAGNALTVAAAGNVAGGSATSYVNGPLARVFTATGAKAFPVGKSGVYRSVTFNYSTNPGTRTVTVEQFEAAYPGSFAGITPLNRYWNISQSGANGPSFFVTLDGTGLPGGTVSMLKKDGATTTSNATGAPNYTNTAAFNTLSATTNFTLGVPSVAPVITSAVPPTSGTVSVGYNHTYVATGTGTINFSLFSGTLPPGLTLTSGGVLSGTPTTVGTYTGTVRASNGTLPDSDQAFSITINSVPVITSANNASFTLGSAGTFTVTTTGFPASTISMAGAALPGGVSFIDNGNGTGTLSGTAAAGTGGTYNLTFTAANGVLPNATQSFTLTVTEGPSFTSATTATFGVGFSGSFTVTAVGNPAPTIALTGSVPALPAGITFTPATGILAGTPTAVGTYTLTFTTTNGVLPDATQTFTLKVKSGPMVNPNGIDSIPGTGNGSISNKESILKGTAIKKFVVKFDQDVLNVPVGDLNYGDSVINPANYMLVMGSSAGVFQTVSCLGRVAAPDVSISVDSVSYRNGGGSGPFVATLSVNGGNPVNVVGFYRLYVCGTTSIVDAANPALELAGDGVNPGTDFILSFSIIAPDPDDNNNTATTAVSTTTALIPVTGFAPDRITNLPAQPADKAYKSMGEIRIEIPTLGVNYPIVGAMFNKNTWDLTWLKDSVAYLEGSAYPTLPGNTVLTAHVVDANNNLGPFSDIKGMQSGQKIYIHANGQIYVYQVQENRRIAPSNISAAFQHEEYNSWITLVTCEDYNEKTGSYKYRRMVRAVLISVISEK